MMSDVPTQAERIPALSGLRDGKEVRKSRLSRGAPSLTRSMNRIASTSSAENMTSRPTITNTWSRTLRRLTSERIRRIDSAVVVACISVRLAETPGEHEARDVEHQSHDQQHQPRREDRLVADAVVRQVAEAHLHDECGDGRGRLGRVPGQVRLQAGCDGD